MRSALLVLLAVVACGQGIESTSFTVLPLTGSTGAPTGPGTLTFRGAFGAPWLVSNDSPGPGKLSFTYSGFTRVILDASGSPPMGGNGVDVFMPSVGIQSTSTNTPGLTIYGFPSQTTDLLNVTNAPATTKYLWVDSSGVTHIANCIGCGGSSVTPPLVLSGGVISCPTCLTTAGGQTVLTTETFSGNIQTQAAMQFFNGSSGPQWQIISNSPNLLLFQDSSSVTRASLNAVQSGSNGILFAGPSAVFTATNTTTPTLLAIAFPSQTADIFDVTNPGGIIGTKYLWVDSSGGTHIANCVAGCGGASVTSPITLSGGAIGCATCLVTGGGQTISGTDTFAAAQIFQGAAQFFNGGSGPQWQIVSNSSNLLLFQDSSSITRASLNAVGTGGNGVLFTGPSAIFIPTNAATPAGLFEAFPGQTSDVFDVTNPGGLIGTKYFWVDFTGATNMGGQVNVVNGSSGSIRISSAGGTPYTQIGQSGGQEFLQLVSSGGNAIFGQTTANGGLWQLYDNSGAVQLELYGGTTPPTGGVQVTLGQAGLFIQRSVAAPLVKASNTSTSGLSFGGSFACANPSDACLVSQNTNNGLNFGMLTTAGAEAWITPVTGAQAGACPINGVLAVRTDGTTPGAIAYWCSTTWHAVF